MTYTLFMTWDWWEETLTFSKREYLLKFLRSGFVPTGCKLTVEHKGKSHAWDREADYAKIWRNAPLTPEFRKLYQQQEARHAKSV